MIDQKIDQQLKRFSSAVAHASPDPLPLSEASRQQALKKPVFALAAAFVVVMLTVGIGAVVVTWTRSTDSTQQPATASERVVTEIEAYWRWLTNDAVLLESDSVGVTQVGPAPAFDPSSIGDVQRLLSYAEFPQEPHARRDGALSIPPVAYVGTIEGTAIQVLQYRTSDSPTGETLLCLEVRGPDGGATGCSGEQDLFTDEIMSLVETSASTSGPSSRIVMAMLPKATAVVVASLPDGRTFVQRPIGGAAAFEVARLDPSFTVSVELLDTNGDVIATDIVRGSS